MVAVVTPAVGSWTVTVNGTGEYAVSVHGHSPVFVDTFKLVDHMTLKHPGFFEIQGQPVAGQPATGLARMGGTLAPVTFHAVSSEGATLAALNLATGHLEAASEDYTGTFTLPTEPFRVVARGVEGGTPFQRAVSALFRPQLVRVIPDSVPESVTPGIESTVSFVVWNAGPPATFDITAHDALGFVSGVSPQTLSLPQNGSAMVQVNVLAPVNPVTGSSAKTVQLTLSAAIQGQPAQANSAFVDLAVKSTPPSALNATYYLHQEGSTVTLGLLQLKPALPDSPLSIATSGNMKGRPPRTDFLRIWETAEGVPGFEGVIPAGAIVTVKLWMKKTTSWGTVFPWASIVQNYGGGATLCNATGTTPLTTTLTAYSFTCSTTQPIMMFSPDRIVVYGGYAMTVGPGNHNMEIQLYFEGTADSMVIVPNPQ